MRVFRSSVRLLVTPLITFECRPGTTWEHEDASEMMLDDLVKTYKIDISAKDVAFIKDLIRGSQKHTLDQ